MPATNEQVQNFVDQRLRPRCEQIRNLLLDMQDDIASISDVYAALTEQNPTWVDSRADGPPNLLTYQNVLAINAFINDAVNSFNADPSLPIVREACVRGPF